MLVFVFIVRSKNESDRRRQTTSNGGERNLVFTYSAIDLNRFLFRLLLGLFAEPVVKISYLFFFSVRSFPFEMRDSPFDSRSQVHVNALVTGVLLNGGRFWHKFTFHKIIVLWLLIHSKWPSSLRESIRICQMSLKGPMFHSFTSFVVHLVINQSNILKWIVIIMIYILMCQRCMLEFRMRAPLKYSIHGDLSHFTNAMILLRATILNLISCCYTES